MRWKQRLVCTYDERDNSAGMKTLQMIVSSENNDNQLKYLLGLLNSHLLNYYCVNYLADDMNKSYLQKIPIPNIDFSDRTDKAHHDRMVALVERMLSLNKQLAEVKTDHEKNLVGRQIEATDKQIDALVYELYGLTIEEIQIVEGDGK